MIWFMLFAALIVVVVGSMSFEQDTQAYRRLSQKLKNSTQNASRDAAVFIDLDKYGDGLYVFDYREGILSAKKSLQDSLNLDSNMKSKDDGYWKVPLEFEVYFYDDSLFCRKYVDGDLDEITPFNYPVDYIDSTTGYSSKVVAPTVFVKVVAPDYQFRFVSEELLTVSRVSSSEMVDRR